MYNYYFIYNIDVILFVYWNIIELLFQNTIFQDKYIYIWKLHCSRRLTYLLQEFSWKIDQHFEYIHVFIPIIYILYINLNKFKVIIIFGD